MGNGAGGGSVLIKSPGSASGGAAAGPDPGAGSGLLLQPASKRARGRSAPSRPVTPRPVPSCPPVPPEMVLGAPVPAPRSHPNGTEPFQQLWVGAFGHRTLILCRISRPVQRKAGCCRSFGSVSTRRARVSKCHDAKKKKKKTPSELGRSRASILVRPRWVGMQAVSRAGGSAGAAFPIVVPAGKHPSLLETASGCFPPRGAGEARRSQSKPLPKSERENFREVSTFPAASRPPAGAVPGGLPGFPRCLGAAAGRVVPAIPGCRRKQERRRRVLSHGQAGGADRRPRAGAPPGGSPRLGRGQAHARQRRRPRVALLRSQGWPGADNISPRLETSEDVLGSPAGRQR